MKVVERWLALVRQATSIYHDTQDMNAQANANLFCFSPREADIAELDLTVMQQFIADTEQHFASLLGPLQTMEFYCWHDVQVRQLRFSLISACHGRLPFNCEYQINSQVTQLLKSILIGDWLNPDWPENSAGLPQSTTLSVYCTTLTGTVLGKSG